MSHGNRRLVFIPTYSYATQIACPQLERRRSHLRAYLHPEFRRVSISSRVVKCQAYRGSSSVSPCVYRHQRRSRKEKEPKQYTYISSLVNTTFRSLVMIDDENRAGTCTSRSMKTQMVTITGGLFNVSHRPNKQTKDCIPRTLRLWLTVL